MKAYTVEIPGEFVEHVDANNEEEAKQLALRMINVALGSPLISFTTSGSIRITSMEDNNERSPS